MLVETASWDTESDFQNNIKYGETPILSNVQVLNGGLRVVNPNLKAIATYIYDYGRIGTVNKLTWYDVGTTYFRIKAANTRATLSAADYYGSSDFNFVHDVVDLSEWNIDSGDYSVVQDNGIVVSGTKQ